MGTVDVVIPPAPRRERGQRVAALCAAASILLAGCLSGCGGERPPPNVLLVVVDTLRADHTSLLGYPRPTTPRLDAFAREGLVFENARATSSWTKPSMATLLTGLPVAAHRVETDEAVVPESATTLAEALWSSGYRTALLSDNPYVSRAFGFAQGYEYVADYAGEGSDGGKPRAHDIADWARRSGAPALGARLLAWLDEGAAEGPWLAHLHYMEPHWPYRPPPAFHARFTDATKGPVALPDLWSLETGLAGDAAGTPLDDARRGALVDAYDASIAFWDDRFGALLDELEQRGELRDTVVAVVSDHGEAFYEHATWAHQNSLYDELVRVPLVLRGPGVRAGRDARPVSTRDLPSTLLALARVEHDGFGSGASLLAPGPSRWTARLERHGRRYLATIERGRKWIASGEEDLDRVEAFALDRDPAERHDVAASFEDDAARIRNELEARGRAAAREGLAPAATAVDPATREALRALGYTD